MGNPSELTSEQAGRGWLEHTVSPVRPILLAPKIIHIGKINLSYMQMIGIAT